MYIICTQLVAKKGEPLVSRRYLEIKNTDFQRYKD